MKKSLIAIGFALLSTACTPDETAEARSAASSSAGREVLATPPEVQRTAAAAIRYVTAPGQNAARYRVREQLVGFELPNDAVGETKNVTGVIAADANGKLIPAESRFTVDAATLTSDRDRRDNFLRRNTLQTEQFPNVTLVPTAVRGLRFPLPTSGSRTFDLVGNLTVRGVTKPTTWRATAQFAGNRVTGSARTAFTFADFNMEQPRVRSVLSVADTIRLELDFNLLRDN